VVLFATQAFSSASTLSEKEEKNMDRHERKGGEERERKREREREREREEN